MTAPVPAVVVEVEAPAGGSFVATARATYPGGGSLSWVFVGRGVGSSVEEAVEAAWAKVEAVRAASSEEAMEVKRDGGA